MKLTDGIFHKIFDEIGEEYPNIDKEMWIVDNGAAKLADTPEIFDVIVMPNLYGDILSDVAAQIAGSVGLAGSANIGDKCAMFEAIHGSAPRRAGQNLANPSGLLLGSVMMLAHIGQGDVAGRVHNAWLKTLEDGTHTYDIFQDGISKTKVGTKEFADAVMKNLGKTPEKLKPVDYSNAVINAHIHTTASKRATLKKELLGVDMFLEWTGGTPNDLGKALSGIVAGSLKLDVISNRGVKVYPNGMPETFCVDHWRCRYTADGAAIKHEQIVELLQNLVKAGFDVIKTENLCSFDGEKGFSAVQGN
jgi:isocitrate dehydrogenase